MPISRLVIDAADSTRVGQRLQAFRKSVDDSKTRWAETMPTIAKLYEKWFGLKPAADSWVHKVAPGNGVPGMEGYDPTPVTPKCS